MPVMFLVSDPVQVQFLRMITEISGLADGITWTEEDGIAIVTVRNNPRCVWTLQTYGFKVV